MIKALAHFHTITKHKILVMKECFRVGLYRQGLLHDLSKYSPTEFRVGCKYYQGTRSPNNAEREDKGYSSAWLHHKGRNKHHYEYWIDYSLDGKHVLAGMKMPVRYVVEMFLDRIAASKVYKGDKYKDSDPIEVLHEREKAGRTDASGDPRPAGKTASYAGRAGRRGDIPLYQKRSSEKIIKAPGKARQTASAFPGVLYMHSPDHSG